MVPSPFLLPAPIASIPRSASTQTCARALARAVNYVGAATVEFLYVLAERKYYFLELNPRLQAICPPRAGTQTSPTLQTHSLLETSYSTIMCRQLPRKVGQLLLRRRAV